MLNIIFVLFTEISGSVPEIQLDSTIQDNGEHNQSPFTEIKQTVANLTKAQLVCLAFGLG